MRLFICEKKNQASDIARVLGKAQQGDNHIAVPSKDIVLCWTFGHTLEQATPQDYDPAYAEWHADLLPIIPQQWKMQPISDKKALLRTIQSNLKQCSEVIIATDAGREGELIAREILVFSGYKGPTRRLWVSALDDASLKKALTNLLPGSAKQGLYQSALCRARLDWLYGMNLTRAYTLMLRNKIPAPEGEKPKPFGVGRVKTPTLSIVVARDLAIENFKSHDFFKVTATVSPQKGGEFSARWLHPESVTSDEAGNCLDKAAAEACANRTKGATGEVTAIEVVPKKMKQPLGYPLDVLQTECGRRFGMRAKKVLEICQSLYDHHKITTYPRADCAYLPTSMIAEAGDVLAAISALPDLAKLLPKADANIRSAIWNDKKVSESDHHAIIPTTKKPDLGALSQEEKLVYEVIARRYLAQFFPAHEYDQTTVTLAFGHDQFRASGRTVRVLGWKELYQSETKEKEGDEEDEAKLPPLADADAVKAKDAQCTVGKTNPPERYTEGTLIEAMKKAGRFVTDEKLRSILRDTSGIGAQSTRTSIIEELINQGLIERKKESKGKGKGKAKEVLISSERGRALIKHVHPSLKNPGLTAVWEQLLDDIAQGKGDATQFMAKQTDFVTKLIDSLREHIPVTPRRAAEERANCPACNGKGTAVRRYSAKRESHFWVCDKKSCGKFFGDNNGELDVAKYTAEQAKLASGEDCPICSKGKLVARKRASGEAFWGCNNYPKCTATAPDMNGKPDLDRARERVAEKKPAK